MLAYAGVKGIVDKAAIRSLKQMPRFFISDLNTILSITKALNSGYKNDDQKTQMEIIMKCFS